MTDPPFFDVVDRQRACRAFTADPVDDESVERILRAATFAPSAENRQPWVFVVVRSAEVRTRLGGIMRDLWDAGAREWTRGHLPGPLFEDVDRGMNETVAEAPVLVVVGGDTRVVPEGRIASSIFPAVQNLLLAANALGLGSALTTLATARADEVRSAVGFPPEIVPLAVVPVGHPARSLAPPRRVDVREKTSLDRYGTPWPAGGGG